MKVDFTNFPASLDELCLALEEKGFSVTSGTGREYYLIKANKVSESGHTVAVDVDDEFNVDLYFYGDSCSERPTHTARFLNVTPEVHAPVLTYITSFTS